jgi:hypothetical protein
MTTRKSATASAARTGLYGIRCGDCNLLSRRVPWIQDSAAARYNELGETDITEAQYEHWRELISLPTAHWPLALQRQVLIAIEREGQRRDVVLWSVAAYCRMTVPTRRT